MPVLRRVERSMSMRRAASVRPVGDSAEDRDERPIVGQIGAHAGGFLGIGLRARIHSRLCAAEMVNNR